MRIHLCGLSFTLKLYIKKLRFPEADCGRSIYDDAGGIDNSRMIVGGTPAREYELPYQVCNGVHECKNATWRFCNP